jgi:cytochrome P450
MPTAVDVFDPRVFARGIPHEAFRRLRDKEPVAWQPEHAVGEWPAGPGFWAVTRYADVRHVLATPADFSSWLGATQIRDVEGDDLRFIRRMILNLDPPEHLRLRRLVTAAFANRRLAELLGMPAEDRHLILRWVERVIGYQDPEHGDVARDERGRPVNPRSPAMLADMFDYADTLADHKRREPADDVMTAGHRGNPPLAPAGAQLPPDRDA